MGYAIAIVAALVAACCFALAAVVQQGAAQHATRRPLDPRLLLALVRKRRWLAGQALGGLSWVIQAVALAFGPLTLVLPLAATDVVFALPMIAITHRYRPTPRDWAGVAAVGAGIAVFLTVSPPGSGARVPAFSAWVPAMLGAAVLVGVSVAAATRVRGRAQTMWLGAAAGVTFGMLDALTKSSVGLLTDLGVGILARWELYATLAAGLVGLLLAQSAFRAGALSLSLPIIDTVEPICAVALGATVFGEQLASSLTHLILQVAGGTVAVVGIALLSHSSIAAVETRAQSGS